MIYPMGILELDLHPIYPTKCLVMCSIWDVLHPSNQFFLDSMIYSNLLIDVGSVMVKSIPEFLIEYGLSDDRTSYVGIVESL